MRALFIQHLHPNHVDKSVHKDSCSFEIQDGTKMVTEVRKQKI